MCEALPEVIPTPKPFASSEIKVVAAPAKKNETIWILLGVIREDPLYIFLSVGIIMLSTVTSLAIPSLTTAILDATRQNDISKLKQLVISFVGVNATLAVLESARHYLLSMTGEKIKSKLRTALYGSLLRQEISFFDKFRSGELINLMSGDVVLVQQAAVQHFAVAVGCVVEVVGAVYKLYSLSPLATAAMLGIIPIVSGSVVLSQKLSRILASKSRKHSADTMNLAAEVFSNIRTVHAFTSERLELEKFQRESDVGFNLEKQYRIFNGGWHLGFNFTNGVLLAAGLYFGCMKSISGEVSVSAVSQFSVYAYRAGSALGRLLHVTGEGMKALDAAERVFDVINRTPQLSAGGKYLPTVRGHIELKDVYFSYPTRPEHLVLRGLNISLRPGTVTALVGASGCGKSTVTSLVDRFYDVHSGSITIDGIDIREVDPHSLRSHIGLVGQEPVMFAGTIADNIRYGNPTASDAEVQLAAEQANAHMFIRNLPEGYSTLVGHVGLSAGQRQRIAIARALLKNPTVLILDEATSQLDSESEHLVQQALDRLMIGRTVLVIAHRLSTVQHADNIAVVHNGQVAESGTHQELMARKGLYSLLVVRQVSAVASM